LTQWNVEIHADVKTMTNVSIRNLTRRSAPRFAYSAVASEVLTDWNISLAFVGPKKALELNKQLRKASYIPNVLSYEVGNKSGEIIICLHEADKKAQKHLMDTRTFVLYLFIHGLLHLKGMAHSGIMERCEKKLVAKFATS